MNKQNNWFTNIYRRVIPEDIRRKYSEMMHEREMNKKTLAELERKSFGDLNKDKTFYVIRTDNTQHWGVFSTYLMVLSNVKFAVEHGWIPVVDYKNYYLDALQDEEQRGKENAWNYYFEDLVPGFPLDEVYRSKNVILGLLRGQPYGSISWGTVADMYDTKYQIYFRLAAEYLRVQSTISDQAESLYQELFPKEGRVLGVSIRAEAYWGTVTGAKNWANHPQGVSVERCIENIRAYMEKYGCDFFFVSCEDNYYINTIKKEFGDRCLYIRRSRANFFNDKGEPNELENLKYEGDQDTKTKRRDYLKEMLLLTRCRYLAKTKSNGNMSLFLIKKEKYEGIEEII